MSHACVWREVTDAKLSFGWYMLSDLQRFLLVQIAIPAARGLH
jgi:hypothetical protein